MQLFPFVYHIRTQCIAFMCTTEVVFCGWLGWLSLFCGPQKLAPCWIRMLRVSRDHFTAPRSEHCRVKVHCKGGPDRMRGEGKTQLLTLTLLTDAILNFFFLLLLSSAGPRLHQLARPSSIEDEDQVRRLRPSKTFLLRSLSVFPNQLSTQRDQFHFNR